MKKGDIVLITFPFTDLSGSKNRPALVLVNADFDVVLAFITTQSKWEDQAYSLRILPQPENGLKKASVVRLGKIATLDKDLIIGKLGSLSHDELDRVNDRLLALFELKEKQ